MFDHLIAKKTITISAFRLGGEGGVSGVCRAGAYTNKQMSEYMFKRDEEGHLALTLGPT